MAALIYMFCTDLSEQIIKTQLGFTAALLLYTWNKNLLG